MYALTSLNFSINTLKPELTFRGKRKPTGDIKFKNVREAENYAARELNLNAHFDNELDMANIVVNAIKDVKDAGYKTPERAVSAAGIFDEETVELELDSGKTKVATVPAEFHVQKNTIYLNPFFPWDKTAEIVKNQHGKKYFSSNNPKHLIYHEAGHYLHHIGDPDTYKKTEKIDISAAHKDIAEEHLGKQAGKDYGEFVAEIFAGMMASKEYPDEVMKIYDEWKGPRPGMKYKYYDSRSRSIPIVCR